MRMSRDRRQVLRLPGGAMTAAADMRDAVAGLVQSALVPCRRDC